MKRALVWFKALCSAAFLAFLVGYVGRQDISSVLAETDPFYLILCLLMAPAMVAASTWKWQVVLHQEGAPLAFGLLFRSYLVGYFFSNFLPSNVGGDVARSLRAGRIADDQALVAASVVVERITGLLGLLALVLLLPWLRGDLATHPALGVPALAALGLLILLALGLLNWRLPASPVSAGGWRARLQTLFHRFATRSAVALSSLRRDRAYAGKLFLLTALFYLLALTNVWLAFRAFDAEPCLLDLAAVLPTAMFVATMPVALGSLGLAEGSYVYYFGLVGMDPAVILAMGLLLRLKIIILGAAGGVLYWTDKDGGKILPGERV